MKRKQIQLGLLFGVACGWAGCGADRAAVLSDESLARNALEAEAAEAELERMSAGLQRRVQDSMKSASDGRASGAGKNGTISGRDRRTGPTGPAASPRKPASNASGDVGYVVHVGAFRVKDNAERLLSRLQADGFPAALRHINHSKNGELYVVHLTPVKTRDAALELQGAVEKKMSASTQVVRQPASALE